MTFKEIAADMFPFWILGIIVIGLILASSKRYLLKIDKYALISWVKFLVLITAIRYGVYLLNPNLYIFKSIKNASFLPWSVIPTVFWEDATHGLPLLILKEVCNSKIAKAIYWIIVALFMVEFGCGHLYQSLFSAIALAFYIPYSVRLGERYGFGTIIIGHILYDASTMFLLKCLMGIK